MPLFSFYLHILISCVFHLSDNLLLHFPPLYPAIIALFFYLRYILLTYLLHCVFTYTGVICSLRSRAIRRLVSQSLLLVVLVWQSWSFVLALSGGREMSLCVFACCLKL
jgi:hypothetical protein